MLVNILFIWARENRDVSYKQGMNEILAIILYGFYPFYFDNNQKASKESLNKFIESEPEKHTKEIYLFLHDQKELASDLFFVFSAVMNKGIKDLYDTNFKKADSLTFKKFDLFQQQWTDEDNTLEKVFLFLTRINLPCIEDVT